MKFIRELIQDLANQIWTFLGLFVGWLVLTGSAKKVIGESILFSTFLWITSFRIRNPKEKK